MSNQSCRPNGEKWLTLGRLDFQRGVNEEANVEVAPFSGKEGFIEVVTVGLLDVKYV